MKVEVSKRKKYILLLLIILVLSAITYGIYVFVNPQGADTTVKYKTDKYSDVTNWCDVSNEEEAIRVDCKALLLSIRNENGDSCFNVQPITKEKELKELTICEKGDTLSYTNEILVYKKLMPIQITFHYRKETILGDYSFEKVAFSKLEETSIQNIVNEDIANLVTIDTNTTTVQNSVDFCPQPDLLPEYISKENNAKYTDFYNSKVMPSYQYEAGFLYNLDDAIIRLLFTCDSRETVKYTNACKSINLNLSEDILKSVESSPNTPKWGGELNEHEQLSLKKLSLLYDSTQYVNLGDNSSALNSLISSLNSQGNPNEEIYCGVYKLLKKTKSPKFSSYLEKMENIIYSNIHNVSSISCQGTIDLNIVDKNGLYLKNLYIHKPEILAISNRCSNLKYIFDN